MGDWIVSGDAQKCVGYSASVTPTDHNVKSAYSEIVAALPFDVGFIQLHQVSGYRGDYLVDIAIGAAGSEYVIVSNILVSEPGLRTTNTFIIPINIPKGTRVAIRAQQRAPTGSWGGTFFLGFFSKGGRTQVCGIVDTYGANEADSGGVLIDPGTSVDTKGAYYEIVSSCNDIKALGIAIGINIDYARSTCYWYVDIAIGASGSEEIIIADLMLTCYSTVGAVVPKLIGMLPFVIPAGSRIAVRASCTINTASDRTFDVALYGAR